MFPEFKYYPIKIIKNINIIPPAQLPTQLRESGAKYPEEQV